MLEVTNAGEFSWREYLTFVTENIEPFPTVKLNFTFDGSLADIDWVIEFLKYLGAIIYYPLEVLGCLLNNLGVILCGFFPAVVENIENVQGVNPSSKYSIWTAILPAWLTAWWR